MNFRYYTLFLFIFCMVFGSYLYLLDLGIYAPRVPFTNYELPPMPVAAWILALIGIFFICTLVLFGFSWGKEFMKGYHTQRDFGKLLSQINEQALNKPIESRIYKNAEISKISKILARFYLKPRLDSNECFESKIDKLFEDYKNVMNGKNVELKSYNLAKDNKFSIQNNKNKIQNDVKFAFNTLSKGEPEELRDYALTQILTNGDKKDLERLLSLDVAYEPHNSHIKELKNSLIQAFVRENEVFSVEFLGKTFKKLGFSQADYLTFTKATKSVLLPDVWYHTIKNFADNDENAEIALFYVMFELEMIEQAKERRALHGKDEFGLIDAYLDLRKSGKRFPLDVFLNYNI